VEKLRHEDGFDGGADFQNELVASGDSQPEALGDLAERVTGGQPPDADGHALAHGDGVAEHGVFLGDGGVEMLADDVEGGLAHAEAAAEFVLREVGAVAALPPVLGAVLDPKAALLRRRGRGGSVDIFDGAARSFSWGGVEVELELVRIHGGVLV